MPPITDKRLLVINAVGLTPKLLKKYSTHALQFYQNHNKAYLTPPIPAVTCTSQTNMLTGKEPNEHGIVANGWFFRELSQIWLWRQSNNLVQAEKIWETIKKRDPSFTCANMFWWYNMYSSADYSATPRPIYRSDGLKLPNVYCEPQELTTTLQEKLGKFPLFKFWGPMTSIESTNWITNASIYVMKEKNPNLCFAYLPHLDYNLQKYGPTNPLIEKDVKELDQCLLKLFETAKELNYETILLSEYGIQNVDTPIHINRELRKNNFIRVTIECNEEHPDPGASRAFAVADHQIAHIYIKNKEDISIVKELVKKINGVASVLDKEEQKLYALDHPRSGELVALAEKNAWFTYYYWLDDQKAPDYARTVDIHKKPGYDPVELFLCKNGEWKAAFTLLKKKLGFRYLLKVIPLDANLVKGSHGVPTETLEEGPFVALPKSLSCENNIPMTEIYHFINKYFS